MSQNHRGFSHMSFHSNCCLFRSSFLQSRKRKDGLCQKFHCGIQTLLLYCMSHCPLGQTDMLMTAAFFIKNSKGHLPLSFFSSGPNSMPGCSVKSLTNELQTYLLLPPLGDINVNGSNRVIISSL